MTKFFMPFKFVCKKAAIPVAAHLYNAITAGSKPYPRLKNNPNNSLTRSRPGILYFSKAN
jgi:hypothetical protein